MLLTIAQDRSYILLSPICLLCNILSHRLCTSYNAIVPNSSTAPEILPLPSQRDPHAAREGLLSLHGPTRGGEEEESTRRIRHSDCTETAYGELPFPVLSAPPSPSALFSVFLVASSPYILSSFHQYFQLLSFTNVM